MTGIIPVLITTFLASAVEAVEMVTIVVGVGATRGWRAVLIGVVAGIGVLAVLIVVSFGASAGQLGAAVIGGAGAVVVIGGIGGVLHPFVTRIPRSFLQLVVGTLLTTFGTFWALEGIGIAWPGGDGAIVGLLLLYLLTASANIALVRRRTLVLAPERR